MTTREEGIKCITKIVSYLTEETSKEPPQEGTVYAMLRTQQCSMLAMWRVVLAKLSEEDKEHDEDKAALFRKYQNTELAYNVAYTELTELRCGIDKLKKYIDSKNLDIAKPYYKGLNKGLELAVDIIEGRVFV